MSNATVLESTSRTRFRSRLFRWAIIGVVAAVAIVMGLYAYLEYATDRELQEAIAEAERLDPGWCFEDMEAARAAVPEAENSATLVLAASALVPKNWRAGLEMANDGPSLEQRVAALAPPQRVDEADLNAVRVELAKVAAALDKARELADWPRGRYRVTWSDDLIGTRMPHLDHPRTLIRILTLDALFICHEG